jgi:hypothetical protein
MGLVTAASVIVTGAITLDSTDFTRMGFRKPLAVVHASAWTSGNVFVPMNAIWDGKLNKIMVYDAAGAALTAIATGTLRLVVLGIREAAWRASVTVRDRSVPEDQGLTGNQDAAPENPASPYDSNRGGRGPEVQPFEDSPAPSGGSSSGEV